MSAYKARRLAELAQSQATSAAALIQRHGGKSDADRYSESLALAIANLSAAVVEMSKE